MAEWADIEYCDFYDIPHLFVVNHAGQTYLFDAPFDGAADDYAANFTVHLLTPIPIAAAAADWPSVHARVVRTLGTVAASSVRFAGESRARRVDIEVLARVVARADG